MLRRHGIRENYGKACGAGGWVFFGEHWRRYGFCRKYAPTRPIRGQMVALRRKNFHLQRVLRSERGYLIPRADGRVVAGSTIEDVGFDKEVTAGERREILATALELCPRLAEAEIVDSWSGLRPGTPDDLPILGPTEIEGLILATGHYRNGILLAPVTARLVREWITSGRTTFGAEAFSPSRFREASERTIPERRLRRKVPLNFRSII